MGRLRILSSGASDQARSQGRGKLFERLMGDVLRHLGYSISTLTPSTNHGGMEIDLEGANTIAGTPLYAECKCYETPIDSTKLQAFCGKYWAFHQHDCRSLGLFIALPCINSHARAFYEENFASGGSNLKVLDEEQVLKAIWDAGLVSRPDVIQRSVPMQLGSAGDWELLYTEQGYLYLQYILPIGSALASEVSLFRGTGEPISDRATREYVTEVHPELDGFRFVTIDSDARECVALIEDDRDEIAEVRGSSACFEYQFPAAPEFFVGRSAVLDQVGHFADAVLSGETSCRGILFKAYSGWGKSSLVLSAVDRLAQMGHIAIAIDSRSASSSAFILKTLQHTLRYRPEIGEMLHAEGMHSPVLSGFEGAAQTIRDISKALQKNRKLLFIFLDQFENLFYLPSALKPVRDLLLSVCDLKSNVVIGFSWKNDLVGVVSEYQYRLEEHITSASKMVSLGVFSEGETAELLDRLSTELCQPLREALRFFLSDFSQGYPWLLKKLCAHVKAQVENGVPQADIADGLLNVAELFEEDLRGLTAEQQDTLARIARASQITYADLEDFNSVVVQSLVDLRLITRIGGKYHVYWDIFRDYLISGQLPELDSYILRLDCGIVLRSVRVLARQERGVKVEDMSALIALSPKSVYNVLRDMRMLGLASTKDGVVSLDPGVPCEDQNLGDALRKHLRDRLRRNKVVWAIMERLQADWSVSRDTLSDLMAHACPYVSAGQETWRTYARVLSKWMDFADLAILGKSGELTEYEPGRGIREHDILLANIRRQMAFPCVHYKPIEAVILRLEDAVSSGERIDWNGLKKSTRAKALATLERFGFIAIDRETRRIRVNKPARDFAAYPDARPELFAKAALEMPSYRCFVDLLTRHSDEGRSIGDLAAQLKAEMGLTCLDSTACVTVKIMLNWARHSGLAPGVFAADSRGQARSVMPEYPSLFDQEWPAT